MQRVRFASRALARRPAFTAIAVLTLALGIGANAAIFSVIDAVLIRPLPYPQADRIVIPWEFSADVQQRLGFDRLPSSPADFTDFHERNTTFEQFASVRGERVNITEGDPERVAAVRVSRDFFGVLGVGAALGRTFRVEDEGAGRRVVIAHGLWTRRFGGAADIAGREVSLNGETATIVGVLPGGFSFPASGDLPEAFGFTAAPEVWTLDVLTPAQRRNRGGKSFVLIGRLKPGATIHDAEADLGSIAAGIALESPRSNAGWTVRVVPLREQLVSRVRPSLMVLLTAVGFVLLIACANVANLLLVRATARRRELTIRRALGATRGRLVLDLLVESLLLAAAAAVAGLAIAWWTIRLLLAAVPANLPALTHASLDLRVLGFTLAIALLTAVGFGLVPALQATRGEAVDRLREGGRGLVGSRRASRVRSGLVVVEVGLAVVLLVGAALLVQTFAQLTRVKTGFDSAGVLTMEIALPPSIYPEAAPATFFEALVARLDALPGVDAAGATSGLPLAGNEQLALVTVEGAPRPEPGHEIMSDYRMVSNGYFTALRIPLRQGTLLPDHVPADGTRYALVNETMAATSWPGIDPLGRRIKLAAYEQDAPWHTIIGVVGDTRHTGLDRALRPQVYADHRQDPSGQMALVIRTPGPPQSLVSSARAAVAAVDPRQPVARVRTMQDVLDASVSSRRFNMFVLGAFAALAVALSLVGLYAVVAFSVAERLPEMAIRTALGARPADLLALVLADGMRLVAAGIAIGLIAAYLLTRFLDTMLFGIDARDAVTFVAVPIALFAAALAGCLIPARRAARVDPASALRAE